MVHVIMDGSYPAEAADAAAAAGNVEDDQEVIRVGSEYQASIPAMMPSKATAGPAVPRRDPPTLVWDPAACHISDDQGGVAQSFWF